MRNAESTKYKYSHLLDRLHQRFRLLAASEIVEHHEIIEIIAPLIYLIESVYIKQLAAISMYGETLEWFEV